MSCGVEKNGRQLTSSACSKVDACLLEQPCMNCEQYGGHSPERGEVHKLAN